jgi:tetratricopeptide (TPR) repeat protein/predicted Ser/Thr protein kinase
MSGDPVERARAFFAEEERPGRPRHGKYELVREAGRGGMAVVWEAWDPDLKRRVALKILAGGSLERLRREAEAAARLRHPGVVTVHEVGPDYLAMDFVEGRTFAEAAAGMPTSRKLEVLERAAEAVAHAHAQGVVHRDLKPQNLLVAADGRVVLTDFGLARVEGAESLTRTGAVVGTPHYMAPEQVRGEAGRIGPATDVWALGVMLYEAVSGRKPFDGPTPLAIHDAIVRSEPGALGGEAGSVAAKALEKDPGRRYADAGAFLADLRSLRSGSRVEARSSNAGRWLRRHALSFFLMVASMAIVAAIVVVAFWVDGERRRVLEALRTQAKISLDAALALRRAGANEKMRQFLPPMEAAFEEVVRRVPDSAEAWWLMGRMYRALMDLPKALRCQKEALRVAGNYAPARYELAVIQASEEARRIKVTLDGTMGEPQTAVDVMDRPGDQVLGHVLSFLQGVEGGTSEHQVAEALVEFKGSGRTAEAKRLLEEVLKSDPGHQDARVALAWVIQSEMLPGVEEREKRWKEAEAVYTAGLDRDRGFVPHWMARGQLRFSRGSARRHRGLDPRVDYEGAEADFGAASSLLPDDVEALTWRGQIRVYAGIWAMEQGRNPLDRFDAADDDFQESLRRKGDFSRAALWRGNGWFYRGVWLASHGSDPIPAFKEAERWLDAAVKLPSSDRIEARWRGRLRAQMGAALSRKGEDPTEVFASAERDFSPIPWVMGLDKHIGQRDPWHLTWWSTVHSERARWLTGKGEDASSEIVKARELLDTTLTLNPYFGEALRHRAMLGYQEGEMRAMKGDLKGAALLFARAAADFEAALAVNGNFRYQVGDLDARARKKADELR